MTNTEICSRLDKIATLLRADELKFRGMNGDSFEFHAEEVDLLMDEIAEDEA